MKTRAGSKRRPLQSSSAENLSQPAITAGSGGAGCRCEVKTVAGCVGKSRSAQELVSDSLRAVSPPRDGGRGRNGGSRRVAVRRVSPLSQEEREQAVESMHREFRARRKAVLNGLPPGSREEVGSHLSHCPVGHCVL